MFGDPPAWVVLADAVLQREALIARVGRGAPPNEFAGLFIDDDEVERLLHELPGMDGALPHEVIAVREQFALHTEQARRELVASMEDPKNQFSVICWNAGLSPGEAEVFALLAAVELEPARQKLIGYIQDNVTLPRPTLASIGRFFPEGHEGAQAVSSDSRLRRAGLIHVPEEGPWGARMVSVHAPVMWSLIDDGSRDPALPVGVEYVRHDGDPGGAPLLLVAGGNRASRLAAALDHGAGVVFARSPMPERPDEWEALVRDSTLKGLTVIVDFDGDGWLPPLAKEWIERASHTNFVISSTDELALESLPSRPWREVRAVDGEASDEEWMTGLGVERTGGHRLDHEQLRLVASALPALDGDLDAAVRRLAGGHLDRLARRIRPRRGWDDVVLPVDQSAQLRELIARYHYRHQVYDEWGFKAVPSAGLVALFAGPSGTGKTLSAEIIAGELGLDLYKIDLSSVVSKYIGETEKNLERIFTAAGAANLVLFFDEADSIFGKRSEVSDAHDRYANIEVSYLLQRMESYDGLIILATNLKKNIDEAFLRRIHVAIEYALPEVEERRRIWELAFPTTAPTVDLDFDVLARQFKIAGGQIRNAGLNAAFLAAEADTDITMETVMLGLKREFQKIGRLRTAEEFGDYHDFVRGGG
ncbi:MAG: ATP-binding protein [Actinomycetota bacterium]